MKIPFVDLQAQYQSIKPEIDHAIATVLEASQFIGGEAVARFESDFAEFARLTHCIGCANGTDALEIALKTLGIGTGDEVLVPALTWIATAGAVKNVGAEPVFVDILEREFTIDPSLIEEKITHKTRAIIPVHLYGLPARMPEIKKIAESHDLWVIEDCAQAHGAAIDNQPVGTFGHIATFSFYPGKNLGAYGDAGAILTNHSEWAERARRLGNHGQLQKHRHTLIGRNSRLDTLQAAILSVKLRHLPQWIETRRDIAKTYSELLQNVIVPPEPEKYQHVYHLYVIRCEKRDNLLQYLKTNGIGCSIHYPGGLPFMDVFGAQDPQAFSVTARITEEILSLPLFPELKKEQQNEVIRAINQSS